jgi:hypothetical protein
MIRVGCSSCIGTVKQGGVGAVGCTNCLNNNSNRCICPFFCKWQQCTVEVFIVPSREFFSVAVCSPFHFKKNGSQEVCSSQEIAAGHGARSIQTRS